MGIFDFINRNTSDDEISQYEQLSSRKPEDPSIKNTLGDLYFKKGMADRAAECYKEAVKIFLKKRQNEKAVAIVSKSIANNVFDIKTADEILSNLFSKDQKEDVISLYVQLAGKQLVANRTAANDIFRKILELDPDNKEAVSFFEKAKKSPESIDDEPEHPEPRIKSSQGKVFAESESKTLNMSESAEKEKNMQAQVLADERKEKRKIDIKIPEKPARPPGGMRSKDVTAESIKDKFLTVAKEKSYLESIILQQNDVIKRLEKEKNDLAVSLRKFADSNKKMKEKLLDFDILRNMEISELRKKIETLIDENKKLLYEKETVLKNLDSDPKNISIKDKHIIESLLNEKKEIGALLDTAKEELKSKDAFLAGIDDERERLISDKNQLIKEKEDLGDKILSMQDEINELGGLIELKDNEIREIKNDLSGRTIRTEQIEAELSSMQSGYRKIEEERNELRIQLDSVSGHLSDLKKERSQIEEDMNRKIKTYHEEISELKTDIDELTSSIEDKIRHIDELNEKVSALGRELSNKDVELHEKIPFLLAKIDELSASIDRKMEENSLFAKELSDLNDRISVLNEELTQKNELLIEISEHYRREKDELASRISEFEIKAEQLEGEKSKLRSEIDEMTDRTSEYADLYKETERDKKEIEAQLSGALKRILELEEENRRNLSAVASKEQFYSELLNEHDSKTKELIKETGSLKSKNMNLTEQIKDKEQLINLLYSEKSDLLKRISEAESEYNKLQSNKNEEIASARHELDSASREITELKSRLDKSLNENMVLLGKFEEITERMHDGSHRDKVNIEMDAGMPGEPGQGIEHKTISGGKRPGLSYALYSVLLIAIIVSAVFLYRGYSPNLQPQKPVQTAVADEKLSYTDIFDRMTRIESSENIKWQVTMLTEPLIRKENAGKDLHKFDFGRFFYFRITINSLKDSLSHDMIKDPFAGLKLIAGKSNVSPASDPKIEEVKTFYRKNEPVSIAFLSAFPKKNADSLELLFNHNGDKMRLTWDNQTAGSGKVTR
ncbi:MAG: hypothetical protein AB1632_07830 [Nitrospirota bacterium]